MHIFFKHWNECALKAPSAKNLRKILGRENAIIKASPIGPEPKNA